jgi:CRISPR-associated endonuclease Cas2
LRLKAANKLLEYGFIRLQKSVFAGVAGNTQWSQLLAWLKTEVVANFSPEDRLLYLPLAEAQAKRFVFLPTAPPDWDDTLSPPNTLFV